MTHYRFAFTGKLEFAKRYTAGLWVREAGYSWDRKLTARTTHLVVGKQNPKCLQGGHDQSVKRVNADKMTNLKIITEEEFKEIVGYKPYHTFSCENDS